MSADLNRDLAPGRYLLTFSYPGFVSESVARGFSDYANLQTTLLNQYGSYLTTWKLNGTTIQPSTNTFLCDVEVTGTPLLVLLTPIIQAVLILTVGYVLLQFLKSDLVTKTAAGVGTGIASVGTGVQDIGAGVQAIGQGVGTGLKYGLPIAAVGLAVIGFVIILGARQ